MERSCADMRFESDPTAQSDSTACGAPSAQSAPSTALLAHPAMSRRVFLKGAALTGALAFLGSIVTSRGTAIHAYADENGTGAFVIYVLSRDEVPIFTFDPSKNNEAIPSVDILITSRYNGKTVSVTTDDVGCALVKIRDLATECDDASALSYTFYGDVQAQKEGYRLVHLPTRYFESAVCAKADGTRPNTVQIPLQVAEAGVPYLMGASLDGYDIQYEVSTACVGSYNDMEHEIVVEIVAPQAGVPFNVTLMVSNPNASEAYSIGSADVVASNAAPYLATATFTGRFLSVKTIPAGGTESDAVDKEAIPAGWDLFIGFVDSGSHTNFLYCPVTFKQGGLLTETGYSSLSVSPGNQSDGDKDLRESASVSSWFDKLDEFALGFPYLGIEVFCNGDKEFGITANIAQLSLIKDENGENKLKDGKNYEFKGFRGLRGKDEWDSFKSDVSDAWNDVAAKQVAMNKVGQKIGLVKATKKIDMNLDLTLKGYGALEGEWGDSPRQWSANIAAVLKFAVEFSYTQQLIVWIIPVYWSFDLSASAELTVRWSFGFEDFFKNINWNYLSDKTESPVDMVLVIHVEAGLAVGIGIEGLASVSVRGYGYLRYVLTFVSNSLDKPRPRMQLYVMAGAKLTVQLLLFKNTYDLAKTDTDDPIIDNWSDADAAALSAAATAQLPGSVTLDDMVGGNLVTDDELALSAEFAGTMAEADGASLATADGENAAEYEITYTRIRPAVEAEASLAGDGSLPAPTLRDPYADNSYDPLHGLKFNSYEKIAEDIYSNSRLKVFGDENHVYSARIATVKLNVEGKIYPRTRLVISEWNGSTFADEQVVDFKKADCRSGIQITSAMRYDVDFDIVYIENGANRYAAIGLTSLTYPDMRIVDGEMSADMVQTFADQRFCTLILWRLNDGALLWQAACCPAKADSASSTGYTRTYSSFGPRVVVHPYPGEPASGTVDKLVTMFHYAHALTGGSSDALAYNSFRLAETKQQYGEAIGDFYPVQANFPVSLTDLLKGSFTVSAGNKTQSVYARTYGRYRYNSLVVLGWSGEDSTSASTQNRGYSFAMELLMYEQYSLPCVSENAQYTIKLPGVSSLMPRAKMATDDLFVYTNDLVDNPSKKFHVISMNSDANDLFLYDKETKQSTVNTRFFPSRDGNCLYAVKVYDGEMPAVSDEVRKQVAAGATIMDNCYSDTGGYNPMAAPKSTEGGAVQRYELLETRWIPSLSCYHEFYPIAQLDFNPYALDVISSTCSDARSFVLTDLTDFDKSLVDIYRFTAPVSLAMHLVSIVLATDTALPGEAVPYDITVANTGNSLITGFYVDIYDTSGKLVSHEKHSNLRDAIREGVYNVEYVCDEYGNRKYDDAGNPLTVLATDARELAGILWPGATRTYRFTFTMPEGYEGQTGFSGRISSPSSSWEDLEHGGILEAFAEEASPAEDVDLNWIFDLDFLGEEIGNDVVQCIDPTVKQFDNTVAADTCEVTQDSVSAVSSIKRAVYTPDLFKDEEDAQSGTETAGTGDTVVVGAVLGAATAAAATAVVAAKLAADQGEDA